MKYLKKCDIVIILSLFVLSFIPNIVFSQYLNKNYTSTYANIKLDGKSYDKIPLSSFKGEKNLTIKSKDGKNTILIKDNTIKIIDADCNDKLCVKQGKISNVGENIICLPHKLIIEIKGDDKDSFNDDMILSH